MITATTHRNAKSSDVYDISEPILTAQALIVNDNNVVKEGLNFA